MLYHIAIEQTVTMDLYESWKEHRPNNQNEFVLESYITLFIIFISINLTKIC